MRIKNYIVLFFALSSFFLSCDTARTIDAPDYFVKFFGMEGSQEGVDMIVNADGSVFLFGNSKLSNKNQQLFLVKADAKGNMLWDNPQYFGGTKNNNYARDLEITSDGRLVLAATSEISTTDNDVLLIIVSQDGIKLDSVLYGFKGTDEDVASVTQTTDGFIATGSTSKTDQKPNAVANDQRDIFLFRFYNDLTVYPDIWNKTFGAGTYDAGVKTIQVSDNLFHFFGYTNQRRSDDTNDNFNFLIIEINNVGESKAGNIYAGSSTTDERLSAVAISPVESTEGYVLTGTSTDASGSNKFYVSKLKKNLNSGDQNQNFPFDPFALPSPLGNSANRKTSVFAAKSGGFFLLSDENVLGNDNFFLTKITNGGNIAWKNPTEFIFGGANEDTIGAVAELPDGKILMIGTFSIGDQPPQKKMVLIKVNKEGKFFD